MSNNQEIKCELKTGEIINGRYEVLRVLSLAGATSEVYEIKDHYDDKKYALKLMKSNEALDKSFNKESSILANLSFSENVAIIKDLGTLQNVDKKFTYIVLDLYKNGSLDKIASSSEYPLLTKNELEYYFIKILRALDSIHHFGKKEMIHKDIKPHNILIDARREPYISDFGISMIMDSRVPTLELIRSGETAGTPRFMSPEMSQYVNTPSSESGSAFYIDTYALGVMLYKYVTGIWPYENWKLISLNKNKNKSMADRMNILFSNIWQDLVKPSVYNPNVPKGLENIILKSLAKDYHKRYQSAKEMEEDLTAFANGTYKVTKMFNEYNGGIKVAKELKKYPFKFSKFFKRFNWYWFLGVGIVIFLLCLAFVLTSLLT